MSSVAAPPKNEFPIRVENLTLAYGETVIQRDLTFSIARGAIFVVMGGSGCGKSTLLRHLVGLQKPASGRIFYGALSFWEADEQTRKRFLRHCGILYQSGALWSSLTVAENVELPLREYTRLSDKEIRDLAQFKLALVGLAGFGNHYPAEISGGMRKRAGLARALALDPDILFFDEPSAGLDPLSARRLDDLILELRESLGATVVMVTHELASIFAIGTDSVFLDAESRTLIARGNPVNLRDECPDPRVRRFLRRGAEE
ncbi:phospholipid/cholesterol/gamma-HCH transport system ATP-binding protein [Geoalkalibacter ferrihydriticus]|uniref:Polyamine ABC transporter ATP-binding protein n=2 Tax=Geoalkalibacter ferrihydriticus TaxID=392333 RepID=A0A0C2HKW4_9BACT|nr:polyamine ABC transporter ATP-binding protein [Geoalkalibacter ferrihydriticus DSM 17813]SDL73530.1 phospholipid/cholesterol/gamma-HCH transport system ATP-binding protein [Geoalkalibacter ferrihydriticus]